jgi:hypothetical protein
MAVLDGSGSRTVASAGLSTETDMLLVDAGLEAEVSNVIAAKCLGCDDCEKKK